MKALVMNCCPVRNGATSEIAKIVSDCLSTKYEVNGIGLCSVECKEDAASRRSEIIEFCNKI